MSTELKEAAQQALKELGEARKIVRASSSRQLAKDWDRRATDALANLRTAIQQAEAQQPDSPSLQAVCRYISDVLGSEAPSGEKHIARTIMHLLPLEQALSGQQPATGEPVMDVRCEGCGYMTHHREHIGCVRAAKQHTHPAPSVPDGLQWLTVAEHGLPEVGEVVVGGLWYTDPWLKPECATSFMWGQCRVVDTKHRDFKDGKQWLTFGPSHNQITHWARLNPPAMLAAKEPK